MDPISPVDRVVLLLRQRLEERERTQRKGGAIATFSRAAAKSGIRAMAALGDPQDPAVRRAFIQTLLADQFGKEMVNDAQFQQVVTRVLDAVDDDPPTSRLLSRLLADLKAR